MLRVFWQLIKSACYNKVVQRSAHERLAKLNAHTYTCTHMKNGGFWLLALLAMAFVWACLRTTGKGNSSMAGILYFPPCAHLDFAQL